MFKKVMCVSEFKNTIDMYAEEIGCDGENIGSHKIRSSVVAYCPETDEYFDIVDFEVQQLFGCGCWSGIQLILKKDKEY